MRPAPVRTDSPCLRGLVLPVRRSFLCALGALTACSTRDLREPDPAATAAERLAAHVKKLSVDFTPRYFDHAANMERCRDYLEEQFRAAGAATELQWYKAGGVDCANVIARIGPVSPRRIVVGAHYDACDIRSAGVNPGADDNASGVAGLLELALLLAQQPPARCSVELVAYCTEEPPFFNSNDMGSHHHARRLEQEGVEVKGVLVFEMIGYFSDEPDSQTYPMAVLTTRYPETGNFISVVGGEQDRSLVVRVERAMKASSDLPVHSAIIPRSEGLHLSDHRNYWSSGFQAVMIGDTAFYRNTRYHKPTDTWDTLDYERMAKVVTGTYGALLALGE